MKVLIASMRAPKVNGVQRAFQKLSHIPQFNNIVFEPMHIESGVQATPLSIDELMTGARQRAETAYAGAGVKSLEAVFSVGVEGGLYVSQQHAFLQSWACVFDGERISFGSSGSIEIPRALSDAVVRDGADLGKVIDIFAEQNDVRSNQGTWGILTCDLITREDSFELATLNALAPFFNGKMYERKTLG
jgi:inosine/xanthosine triphosphatase